jgi:hypothetical protein
MQANGSYSLAVLLNEEERLASHDVSDAHPVGTLVALRLNLTTTGPCLGPTSGTGRRVLKSSTGRCLT